ncbi:class-II fumarase/aspartase family protein [Kibdelosporangium aridum]|uniref:Adenylosuccinate lyase n=1 Tax=Kibdelosporangium aridum TaxID=2030 RepID=A0A1W1ZJC6_KIBAR|nr:adenylosuccinate lyase family protein [Kibdelosporangium aridum]SMC48494.1 adenylosuccinate lyase [Kibdelosporangium aridum]
MTCTHERSHIVDSTFYGHNYSTPASHRIFCDRCRFQRWLDIEATLALVQAEIGIIPADAAERIAASAKVDLLDLDAVRAEIRRTRHSLVGLLRVFQAACGDAGEFVHYGATTQDIQDTGQALEMRDVLDEIESVLRPVVATLADIADEHADTVALGRTHARPALPIGFGLKVAGWIDEIMRDCERIRAMRGRVLAAQLFGGVGTMAGFGDAAPDLLQGFAARLGLTAPPLGWHVARDRVAEYVSTLAITAGTLGRIGDEIRTLSRPEFGEFELGWRDGHVGSSTMPHKRNPEACQQIVVLARLAAASVNTGLAAMIGDHERDSRALRLEWACIADVSHYTLAACAIAESVIGGLAVRPQRIGENVADVTEQVITERLMLAMGRHVGKQTAHEHVYQLSQRAQSTSTPLRELLAEHEVGALLNDDELARIFEPSGYLGQSASLTRRTVTEARKWLGQ